MTDSKKDNLFRYIRNLTDEDLLKALRTIYDDGYTDGYNGNDGDNEFLELLEEYSSNNKRILDIFVKYK